MEIMGRGGLIQGDEVVCVLAFKGNIHSPFGRAPTRIVQPPAAKLCNWAGGGGWVGRWGAHSNDGPVGEPADHG